MLPFSVTSRVMDAAFPKESVNLTLYDKYEVVSAIAEGSFGSVIKAWDVEKKQLAAVKCFRDISKSSYDQVSQEINIVESLNLSDNSDKKYVVRLLSCFFTGGYPNLVFEYLPFNLRVELETRTFFYWEVVTIAYSLLKSLVFLSTALPGSVIVHGDLKPENIMFDAEGRLKLVDFGLSFCPDVQDYPLVQSLYYRAPEVFLYERFGNAIDVWSVGCIVAECFRGKILFKGSNGLHQLMKIAEVLGMPPQDFIHNGPRKSKYFDEFDGLYVFKQSSHGYSPDFWCKSISEELRLEFSDYYFYDRSMISLVESMLLYEPSHRIAPVEALRMPMFYGYHFVDPKIRVPGSFC